MANELSHAREMHYAKHERSQIGNINESAMRIPRLIPVARGC